MTITKVEQGKKNRRRLNFFLDGEYAFACFAEVASEFGLRKGASITDETVEAVKTADDAQGAREYAFRYAARGIKSEKQFRDKMSEKKYLPQSIEAAIQALKHYGYIDDGQYADMYASELLERYGPWVVRRKLKERGISDEIIARVLEGADTGQTLSRLLEAAMRKYHADEPRRQRDRVTRYLASRGFGFDEIKDAIRSYESSDT